MRKEVVKVKRYVKKCVMIFKFILKEVFVKYIFCYALFATTLLISFIFDVQEPWKSWLISLSASMFSLPVVFVVYTLYNEALNKQTRKKVSCKLDEEINNIFARFIFFTHYFYDQLGEDMEGSEEKLNSILNYNQDYIFEKVSDNIFSGMILFSEFDSYDDYVFDAINQPIIAKYINEQEVALLFDFIKLFKRLKEIFKFVNKSDFILYGKYENIKIEESSHTTNSQGKKVYDVSIVCDEEKYSNIYTAIFPLYEKEKLMYMLKLSGNKSKEIASAIFELYVCIKNWLRYQNKERITVAGSLVFGGRLYLDADLIMNEYMDENFAISVKF